MTEHNPAPTAQRGSVHAAGAECVPVLDIVFDGPPGPEGGRFIECETDGHSVNAGEWLERPDGHWVLRVDLARAGAVLMAAAARPMALHLADTARLQIRRCRGDADLEVQVAALYESLRRTYAAGGAVTGPALRELADDLGVDFRLAMHLRIRAAAQGEALADAPTGAELLAQVRAELAAEARAPVPMPTLTTYERYRRSATGD